MAMLVMLRIGKPIDYVFRIRPEGQQSFAEEHFLKHDRVYFFPQFVRALHFQKQINNIEKKGVQIYQQHPVLLFYTPVVSNAKYQIKNMNKMPRKKKTKTDHSLCEGNRPFISVGLKETRPKNKQFWIFDREDSSLQSPTSKSFIINGHNSGAKKRSFCGKSSQRSNRFSQKRIATEETQVKNEKKSEKYRVEDFLGVRTSRLGGNYKSTNSKRSALKSLTESKSKKQVSYITEPNRESEELVRQNLELLKINEQLLYEKQYYKQKNTLQEVMYRDLERKLKNTQNQLMEVIKKTQRSKKEQAKRQPKKRISQNFENEKTEVQNCQKENFRSDGLQSSHSSLLISHSSRKPLKEKSSNIIMLGDLKKNEPVIPVDCNWVTKTQNQFSDLLESVQKENNQNRKMTLRKMLANKAMELKRIKGKN